MKETQLQARHHGESYQVVYTPQLSYPNAHIDKVFHITQGTFYNNKHIHYFTCFPSLI